MSVSRIHRLLRLITMLQSGRTHRPDEIAAELEISRRTVFRDLNMLEMAHIPYYFDEDRGGYRISQHFFLPPINLTVPEALAIMMLAGRMRGSRSLPLLTHGSRAAMKIESALPGVLRQHVGSVIGSMSFSLGPVSRHEGLDDVFDRLAQAVAARNVCRIVYLSFQERKQLTFDVQPLRLSFQSRAWYLIAYCPKLRAQRTFKVIRIRKLTVANRTFELPHGLDPESPFGQAWSMIPEGKLYDVHLRFGTQVAGNVAEVQWHASQSVEWNDDGSIEFHVRVDGIKEIAWWILGYGDQVEVVEPAELATRVAGVAQAVAGKYSLRGN